VSSDYPPYSKKAKKSKSTSQFTVEPNGRSIFLSGHLYAEKNCTGLYHLDRAKADGRKKEITSFVSVQEGKNLLFKITAEYQLRQKLNGLYETRNGCFQHKD